MPLYQTENSLGDDRFDLRRYTDYNFAVHLHRHPEIVLLLDGEMTLEADGRSQTMRPGDAALILTHQAHAYRTATHSESLVLVFSSAYVPDFLKEIRGTSGESSVFHPSDQVFQFVCAALRQNASVYERKAALYALCACFREQVALTPSMGGDELIARLLQEVGEHYTENLTLAELADRLGYERHYLSRRFHQAVPMHFKRLLSQYRTEYAAQLLDKNELSIEEIALQSGFQSVRHFDRTFLQMTGQTPSAYRAAKRLPLEKTMR